MSNVVPLQPSGTIRAFNGTQIDLIRRTVAKDTNQDEFDLFCEVCRRTGLDPFRKQIYAFVFSKDDPKKRQLTIVTGIDGYRAMAARSGNYRPASTETEFTYDEAVKDSATNPLGLVKARVTVHQQDRETREWFPVVGEAYWDEFAPIEEEVEWVDTGEVYQDSGKPKRARRGTGRRKLKDSWLRMPRVLLGKCGEAQALRRGWPEELSGLYSDAEMDQALAQQTATQIADEAAANKRLEALGHGKSITVLWAAGERLEAVPLGQMADRCFAFLKAAESPTQIQAWGENNRVSLQQFWAQSKTDALAVKAAIEKRIKELEAASC